MKNRGIFMNIIRMSGGLGNQMFQYALYMKLCSMGKEVKFDDINEYRSDDTRPIMLALFGIDYPRATWDEIIEFTDGSMEILKRLGIKKTLVVAGSVTALRWLLLFFLKTPGLIVPVNLLHGILLQGRPLRKRFWHNPEV